MKKLVLAILVILLLEPFAYSQNPEEVGKIIQQILDLPDLQRYYHPELKERIPIKILESDFFDKNLQLKKFEKDVRIISSDKIKEENIKDYLVFRKLVFKAEQVEFELNYLIEGIGSTGVLVKTKEGWVIQNYSVWEN